MVWGSPSRASAVAAAVRPWTSSQMACHRSLSLGVGATIIRLCRSLTFISHYSRNRSFSLTPFNNPSQFLRPANPVTSQI